MRIVVAVGGNALIKAGQAGTWPEQLANVREIAEAVLALRAAGHEVVLTHGNGPQVGALLLQNALGEGEAAPLPLDALIAMTQGQIGYLLESAFAALDPRVPTAVLLTRVLVDPPTRRSRTRPSRSARSTTRRRRSARARRARLGRRAGRRPRLATRRRQPASRSRCFGEDNVRRAARARDRRDLVRRRRDPVSVEGLAVTGVAGVIDKDRCSERLAVDIRADVLVLLTGVPQVSLDFGTRWERALVAADRRRRRARPAPRATSRPGAWARRWSRRRASSRSRRAGAR